jgi:hypothetical protein
VNYVVDMNCTQQQPLLPFPLRSLPHQPAPIGAFGLKDVCLREAIHQKTIDLSAALDCSLSSPDAVWRAFKEGESCQGKCSLMQQCKRRPENASGRNCLLDVTLTCCNGVESKHDNRVKAEAGPSRDVVARNKSSTGLDKQHRRSRIAHGQSTKLGCLFKVILKQWQDDPALYLIVVHHAHTNDVGMNVHDNQGLSRISEACKQRVHERILQLTAPKAIVAGRPYSLINFVHAKLAIVHKID